jgi:hypothetical protein
MIKIEFPAGDKVIAAAIGRALLEIGGVALNHSVREKVGNLEVETITTTQPVAGAGASSTACDDQYTPDPGREGVAITVNDDLTPPDDITIGAASTAAIINEVGATAVTVTDTSGTLPQVDHKRVPFSAAHCSVAARPFYESGARSGQWKKRKGVADSTYADWYAAELLALAPAAAGSDTVGGGSEPLADTSGAFNGQGAGEDPVIPQDCGAFMVWASAKQAANLLTQKQIGEAYETAGFVMTDLFPPNDPATVAYRVGQVYGLLAAQVGA